MVWLAISNSSGWARMIASTCWPCAVSLITPVAKIVAQISLATRKPMMSTAGSMRPPMSKVSATPGPALGMVRKTWMPPAATRLPAVHPVPPGAGVGLGVEGSGVTPGPTLTTSSQPGSMTFGSVSSDGWRSAFHCRSWSTVVAYARAMAASVSPARTMYVVPDGGNGVGAEVGASDAGGPADAGGRDDASLDGVSDGAASDGLWTLPARRRPP